MVRFHKRTPLLGLCCCLGSNLPQPMTAREACSSHPGRGSVKRISVVDSTDTPRWMPDGKSILYVAHTSIENTFHLVSTPGEKLRLFRFLRSSSPWGESPLRPTVRSCYFRAEPQIRKGRSTSTG